jgi:hypothetical protein
MGSLRFPIQWPKDCGNNTNAAGVCINPPPPAIASVKPARKANTQRSTNSIVMFIFRESAIGNRQFGLPPAPSGGGGEIQPRAIIQPVNFPLYQHIIPQSFPRQLVNFLPHFSFLIFNFLLPFRGMGGITVSLQALP